MSKFRFGDRVKNETGNEFTVCGYCPITRRYLATIITCEEKVVSWWHDRHKLETAKLLPKTKNEILKDMIDGVEYVFDNGDSCKFGWKILRYDIEGDVVCAFYEDEEFPTLTRIEQPVKHKYKLELTEEEYAKIQEILK